MADADPALVQTEKQMLKSAFTYRNLRRDTELVLENTERAMFAEANRAGHGLYGVASQFVLDCYYERGALEPLVTAYSGQPYRRASRFDRLLQHLHEAQRADLIERFWTSIARLTRAEFVYQRPRRDHGDHAGAEEFKNYALDAYTHAIDWLTRLGRIASAEKLAAERNALRDEQFRSLPPPSDLRRMDPPVFWDVISSARSQSSTTLEQLAVLAGSLCALRASDIKRFGSLYAKAMQKVYHWNVWALGYAALGGCSDGTFEAFRTWLILQGDPALLDLALTDPAAAATRVPPEPDLPEGHLLLMIEEAYFQRDGSLPELPCIDLEQPQGTEWQEDAFATMYPELVRHYSSMTASLRRRFAAGPR